MINPNARVAAQLKKCVEGETDYLVLFVIDFKEINLVILVTPFLIVRLYYNYIYMFVCMSFHIDLVIAHYIHCKTLNRIINFLKVFQN